MMSSPEVEEILDRKVYSGKVYYKTKWKGHPEEQATWEDVKTLNRYRHLIKQYQSKHRIDSKGNPIKQEDEEELLESVIAQKDHTSNKLADELQPGISPGSKKKAKKEISPFNHFKRRGRPPKRKSLQSSKVEEKKHLTRSLNNINIKIEAQSQPHPPKKRSVSSKQIQRQTSTHTQEKNENNDELIRIYFCEKLENGKMQYIIEEKEKKLRKCDTEQLMKLYAKQLVDYLQKSLLSRKYGQN